MMKSNSSGPEDQMLVIFGATGDLSKRKLMPSLFALENLDLLPDKFAIVGAGRSLMSDETFRDTMREALKKFSPEEDKSKLPSFISKLFYQLSMTEIS